MAAEGMSNEELEAIRKRQRRRKELVCSIVPESFLADQDLLLAEVDRLRLQGKLQGPIPREYIDPKEYD